MNGIPAGLRLRFRCYDASSGRWDAEPERVLGTTAGSRRSLRARARGSRSSKAAGGPPRARYLWPSTAAST
ncbi:MAG: hypothetical protein R3F62_14530 [Planctomycetota bacterium]